MSAWQRPLLFGYGSWGEKLAAIHIRTGICRRSWLSSSQVLFLQLWLWLCSYYTSVEVCSPWMVSTSLLSWLWAPSSVSRLNRLIFNGSRLWRRFSSLLELALGWFMAFRRISPLHIHYPGCQNRLKEMEASTSTKCVLERCILEGKCQIPSSFQRSRKWCLLSTDAALTRQLRTNYPVTFKWCSNLYFEQCCIVFMALFTGLAWCMWLSRNF